MANIVGLLSFSLVVALAAAGAVGKEATIEQVTEKALQNQEAEVILPDSPHSALDGHGEVVTEVRVRNDPTASVVELNRFNLAGNVYGEDDATAENWFVLFCVEWDEVCEHMATAYARLSSDAQAKVNAGVTLRPVVRFGWVSCAKDKPLCNEFLIDEYPMVLHFARGRRGAVPAWSISSKVALAKWVHRQLSAKAASSTPVAERPAGSTWQPRGIFNLVAIVAFLIANLHLVLSAFAPFRQDATKPAATSADEAAASAVKATASAVQAPKDDLPRRREAALAPDHWARDRPCLEI